jgi:hypothetical protein
MLNHFWKVGIWCNINNLQKKKKNTISLKSQAWKKQKN